MTPIQTLGADSFAPPDDDHGECQAAEGGKRVARLRAALLKSVTPEDVQQVVVALVAKAKGGDVPAARELFQRLLGPAEAVDMMERLESLEAMISESAERKGGQQPWRGN